jgi:hypothetical protein
VISYLLSVLSFILLVPIFYFIPTGFSKKGKLTVLTVSFLLAAFGLFANGSLGLWKTVLILFILILFITYLLNSRMQTSLFESAEDAEEAIQSFESTELAGAYQPLSYPVHTSIEKEEKNDDVDVSQSDENIERSDSFEFEIGDIEPIDSHENEIDEIKPIDSLEDGLIDQSDFLEKEASEGYEEDHVMEETAVSLFEEKEDLYLDELLLTDNVEEEIEDQFDSDEAAINKENIENEANYMAELEKIIMESEPEQEHPEDETIETESHIGQKMDTIDIPDVPVMEEIELLELEDLPLNHYLEETEEMIPPNEIEEVQIAEAKEEDDESILAEEEGILPQEEQEEQSDEAKEKLQHQMFQIMLSQIELARKMIDKNKYEQLVKDYMHPGLPLSEYYTFASLLIQHYLTHKEFEKLKSLLDDLEKKYVEYPILLQEIKFLQTHYFHK